MQIKIASLAVERCRPVPVVDGTISVCCFSQFMAFEISPPRCTVRDIVTTHTTQTHTCRPLHMLLVYALSVSCAFVVAVLKRVAAGRNTIICCNLIWFVSFGHRNKTKDTICPKPNAAMKSGAITRCNFT